MIVSKLRECDDDSRVKVMRYRFDRGNFEERILFSQFVEREIFSFLLNIECNNVESMINNLYFFRSRLAYLIICFFYSIFSRCQFFFFLNEFFLN